MLFLQLLCAFLSLNVYMFILKVEFKMCEMGYKVLPVYSNNFIFLYFFPYSLKKIFKPILSPGLGLLFWNHFFFHLFYLASKSINT